MHTGKLIGLMADETRNQSADGDATPQPSILIKASKIPTQEKGMLRVQPLLDLIIDADDTPAKVNSIFNSFLTDATVRVMDQRPRRKTFWVRA